MVRIFCILTAKSRISCIPDGQADTVVLSYILNYTHTSTWVFLFHGRYSFVMVGNQGKHSYGMAGIPLLWPLVV